jgi:hypothetical protein
MLVANLCCTEIDSLVHLLVHGEFSMHGVLSKLIVVVS